jgi:hypothetical protein
MLRVKTIVLLAFASHFSLPHAAWSQGLGAVLRAGAGIDSQGDRVVGAQIGIIDFGNSSSVEIAVALFEASLVQNYSSPVPGLLGTDVLNDYHEDTRVRGAGPIASVLIGQGPRDSRGPYLGLGLGMGAFDVDWLVESPHDRDLGTARPGGGSMRDEDTLLLGGLGSVGLGFRFHRRLDVRAQALTLLTPSTGSREDAKLLTTFVLMAGVGI